MAGLLGSLFSGLISHGIAANDSNRQFQRQNYLLGRQNQFNELMWEKSKNWNSQDALFKRFTALGMSPTAALQATTGNITGANPLSSSSAPSVAGMNPSIKELYGDIGRNAIELENIKADTRAKNADASRNEDTLYYDIQNLIAQNNVFKAEYDKIQNEIGLTTEQKKYQDILNKYADKKSQEEINLIIANYHKVLQETEFVNEEKKKVIWENYFRDNFGIDPHDNYMAQLVQASIHGDMSSVLNAFEKTANVIWDKAKDWINTAANNFTEIKNDLIPEITTPLKNTSNKLKDRFKTIWRDWDDMSYKFIFGNPLKWGKKGFWKPEWRKRSTW